MNANTGAASAVITLLVSVLAAFYALSTAAATDKPNILVIWGDDTGWSNISAYHRGMLGGSTLNIDRIAREGVAFTDYYGQQSCTAGRAAFISGSVPVRSGMTKDPFINKIPTLTFSSAA